MSLGVLICAAHGDSGLIPPCVSAARRVLPEALIIVQSEGNLRGEFEHIAVDGRSVSAVGRTVMETRGLTRLLVLPATCVLMERPSLLQTPGSSHYAGPAGAVFLLSAESPVSTAVDSSRVLCLDVWPTGNWLSWVSGKELVLMPPVFAALHSMRKQSIPAGQALADRVQTAWRILDRLEAR